MWDKVKTEKMMLVMIDMQDKFFPLIDPKNLEPALKNIQVLIQMLNELQIPMLGTEHYVKGLGHTDPRLMAHWKGPAFIDKVTFSCWGNDNFRQEMEKINRKSIIVVGLETHICVLQTVLDLVANGHDVYVLSDACLSSTTLRWKNGLSLMKDAGAHILNTESLLFYLLQRVDRPEFKTLVKLLKA